MPQPSVMQGRIYKFGLFELNTSSRQLLKQGRRVRVQEQPLRLLEVLLEQPGKLVKRSELQQRLWPRDIHVDFEMGLAGAIKRLRRALGDSGENPRFVETLPKSGFRFIAPVQILHLPDSNPVIQEQAHSEPGTVAIAAARAGNRLPKKRQQERDWRRIGLTAVLAAVTVVLAFLLRPQAPMPRVVRITKLSNSGRAWPHESLLTDGARVYYTELNEAKFQLRQILLNGNEDTPVGGLPEDSLVRGFTPDRTMFVTISQAAAQEAETSALRVVPVIGGPARRLGRILSNDFAWSPDGSLLAFMSEQQALVGDPQGEHARVVANTPGHPFLPRWSPDGKRLRFTVQDAKSQLSIWEVSIDGGNSRPLHFELPGSPREGFGEWMPGGKYFVFASLGDQISNLWIVEEEHDWLHRRRNDPVQLTAGPLNYYRPLPSRDGKRIFAIGTESRGELAKYDAKRTQYVPFMDGRSADHLDFSRNGQWVAYVAFPEGTLWRARSDGSEPLQLTFAPLKVMLPRWSPDNKRIVFTGSSPGQLTRVFTISAEGGSPEPISAEPHVQADASWTPTGDILYGHDPDENPQDLFIYRLNPNTGKAERIPHTEALIAPLCSPDGRTLVAFPAGGDRWLTLFDLATGKRTTLTRLKAIYPSWSPDSRYIYFNTMMHDQPGLYRVRVEDGSQEKLAEVPFIPTGIFGAWSGVAPDGSLILLRDRSQTDIYALTLDK